MGRSLIHGLRLRPPTFGTDEEHCTLKSVTTSDAHNFTGRFGCVDEGEHKWTGQISLKLDKGALIHAHQDGRISRYARCK